MGYLSRLSWSSMALESWRALSMALSRRASDWASSRSCDLIRSASCPIGCKRVNSFLIARKKALN